MDPNDCTNTETESPEPCPTAQEPGSPEAGRQWTLTGELVERRPQGRGRPTQGSLDDLLKLDAWHKA